MLHSLTGDQLEWKRFTFEIIDMDRHRIDKILLSIPDGMEDKEDAS